MAKVVTSHGLTEFIQTGKTELMDNPEIKEAPKTAPPPEEKAETPAPLPPPIPAPDESEGLEADDIDLTEHVRKKINKKHRQMKEAQEAQADAEAFAKNQYDRARLAEERAASLEKELGDAKKVTPPVPELKAPDEKDAKYQVNGQFDWKQFSNDQAEFVADKKLRDYTARVAQEREQQELAEQITKFKTRAEKIPDFMKRMESATVWFPQPVLDYLRVREDGPELSVHLAENPETAERIAKMKPILAIDEIVKLADSLKKPAVQETATPKPVERGGAPPPITPISGTGTGTINTDPSKMSFRELREYERNKRQKR